MFFMRSEKETKANVAGLRSLAKKIITQPVISFQGL
jgi:hypothetical protein